MKKILLFPFALIAFSACKRDAEDLPIERPFTRDFYAQGEWRDSTTDVNPVIFDYTVGKTIEPPFFNVYTCRTNVEILDGYKTIRCEFLGTSNTNPLLTFRFTAPLPAQPGEPAAWTRAELEDLLVPGKVFQTSGAPGEVEIDMRTPFQEFSFPARSRLSPAPAGQVTVVASEDYTWARERIDGSLIEYKAKKVRLTFDATLGVVDFTQAVIGQAEVQKGEAVLYLEHL